MSGAAKCAFIDSQNVTQATMKRFRRRHHFRTERAPLRFALRRDFWKTIGQWVLKQITPARVLIALIAVPILVYVWREATREVLIVDPFTVPKRFEEAGITPEVMANRIGDAMRQIEFDTQISLKKEALAGARDEETIPDVQIPGTKFGLKEVIDVTRGLFRIYPKRISGDIVFPVGPSQETGPNAPKVQATVTIYVSQGRSRGSGIQMQCAGDDVAGMVQHTAELVLRQINPYLLAAYKDDHKEYDRAIEIVQAMSQDGSQDQLHRAAALALWGDILADQKNNAAAIGKFQQAAELDPKLALAYYNWGLVLFDEGRYDEAIAKFQKTIEFDPKDADAYLNWGSALNELKKYGEAAAKFKKATEIEPKNANAYIYWGNALSSQGKYDEAIPEYRRTIEIDPKNAVAYGNWGLALAEQKRYDEAAAKFQKTIEFEPSAANAYNYWGNMLVALQRYDDAIDKYKKAIELDPKYADPYNNWGMLLGNQGKFDEAAVEFGKAIEIDPKFGIAYLNLGTTLESLGKHKEAAEARKKANELSGSR